MALKLDPVQFFPQEISCNIFSFLDQQTLGRCCQVSTQWKVVSSDNVIWENFANKIFHEKIPGNIKSFLKELDSQISSNDEIVKRVQKFVNKISLGKNGRFRCICTSETLCQTISIEIKTRENNLSDLDCRENCFFNETIKAGVLNKTYLLNEKILHLWRKSSIRYREESMISLTTANSPIHGNLHIPEIYYSEAYCSPLQKKLENIIASRLDDLESDRQGILSKRYLENRSIISKLKKIFKK